MSIITPNKHISRSNTHDERFPVSITCNNCKGSFRAYNIGPVISTHKYKYCIVCASDRIYVRIDIDTDYWEVLARSYKLTPEAIEQIYSTWDQHEHLLFADHVKQTKKLLRLMRKVMG